MGRAERFPSRRFCEDDVPTGAQPFERDQGLNDLPMKLGKMIWRTIMQIVQQARLLPQTVAHAFKGRRHLVPSAHEIERLDRLRNPSKYLGK